MKRNLLNVALFGLLAVALPASTFVSCKDYDEDFSRIEATMKSDKQALEAADAAINSKLSEVEAKIKDLEPRVKGNEDEIAKLKAAVMSLEDAKKTIDAAIKKLEDEKVDKTAYAKDLAEINAAIEAAKKAGAAIEKKADKAIADAAAAATAAAAANDAAKKAQMDIDNYKTATDKVLAAQTKTLEEYKKLIDGKADKGTTTGGGQDARVDNLIKEVEALQAKLKGVTTAADQKDVSDSLLLLAGKIKELDKASNTLLNVIQEGAALRSLVFQPDFYYGGIEAMEAAGFVYTPWEVKPVNPNDDFSKDAPVAGKDEIAFSPLTWASYHLNPSFANVSEDPANYQLIALNREYRSAADTVRTSGVADVVVKDGMVNVGVDFSSLLPPLTIAHDDSVTVVALQYMQKADNGDSIITSDYAALTANWYGDIKIINPKQTTKYTHTNAPGNVLYENATKAINEHPTVLVEWDDEDGINLLEHVLAIANPTGTQDYVVLGGAEDGTDPANSEEYGLEYAFELVGYHKGVNKTSESAQAKLDSKGNILRAQNTVGGKQAEWGAAQNIATVGREPLVRVKLVDQANKKIVAVGYIKLEIVKKAKTISIPLQSDSAYVASCGTGGKIIGELAWHQVQEGILSKLNMSREDFAKTYEPDFTPGEEAAKAFQQFAIGKDGVAKPLTTREEFGKIWHREEVMAGVNTDVIRWSVGNHTLYKALTKDTLTEKTAYIRYKLRNGSAGEYDYIYLPFTWKPKSIKTTPEFAISNNDKIANNWFKENTDINPAPKAADGFDQMHANIDVPNSTSNNANKFELELLNGFVGNKVNIAGIGKGTDYPNITNPDPNFVFVPAKLMKVMGASGNYYALSISEDGKTLKATNGTVTEDVAKIEGTKVALQQASEFAKDLLNNAAHKELDSGQTFTARIGIKPTFCAPISALEKPLAEFDVKFLRPINATSDREALTDAKQGKIEAPVANKVYISDWREEPVKANPANWTFYRLSGIEKAGDITTDLNGGILGETKLTDVSKNVIVNYVAPTNFSPKDFGKVVYENNNNVTSDFTVRVPLMITYAWGKVKVNYDLLIRRTTKNAPRK